MESQRKAVLNDFPSSRQLIDIAFANRQFADGMLVPQPTPAVLKPSSSTSSTGSGASAGSSSASSPPRPSLIGGGRSGKQRRFLRGGSLEAVTVPGSWGNLWRIANAPLPARLRSAATSRLGPLEDNTDGEDSDDSTSHTLVKHGLWASQHAVIEADVQRTFGNSVGLPHAPSSGGDGAATTATTPSSTTTTAAATSDVEPGADGGVHGNSSPLPPPRHHTPTTATGSSAPHTPSGPTQLSEFVKAPTAAVPSPAPTPAPASGPSSRTGGAAVVTPLPLTDHVSGAAVPSTLASAALLANLKTPRERALAKMRQKLVESRMHATAAGFDGGGGGGEGGEAGAGDIDAEAVALVTGHALGGRYERWVGSVSVWVGWE